MKEDSVITQLFRLLAKVVAFIGYCIVSFAMWVLGGLNNWLKGTLKK